MDLTKKLIGVVLIFLIGINVYLVFALNPPTVVTVSNNQGFRGNITLNATTDEANDNVTVRSYY